MFNYVTQTAKHGKEPEDFTYLEIKATKNKDGSPQVQPYRIIYSEHEAYKTYFLKLYTDVIVKISQRRPQMATKLRRHANRSRKLGGLHQRPHRLQNIA